jgi:hypothetical protein
MNTVSAPQVATSDEALRKPLPERVEEALGELADSAAEGLMARGRASVPQGDRLPRPRQARGRDRAGGRLRRPLQPNHKGGARARYGLIVKRGPLAKFYDGRDMPLRPPRECVVLFAGCSPPRLAWRGMSQVARGRWCAPEAALFLATVRAVHNSPGARLGLKGSGQAACG